ncbi:hypothetical protein QU617_10195 [Pseudomonas guariconensis]|uniref:OB-fold protein n=1 Tax=Pseudomonas guariconensis TaxID=1288410 RepID=UPI0025A985BE|nr:hypothetical protein [Pseudomonas guariconensis]MDM9593680.1 hypothetical protein [Pseudomonas guariconensis]MDM9606507.1 hypothetical protein [Pseudomonas guariconensis]MDM9611463.1 hypothetical protein [Pseudomonas guariconensis]
MIAYVHCHAVVADQQFKGKRFKVTGVVDSTNTDLFGNPYVTLRGGVKQLIQRQFELDKAHAKYAAGLRSGMRITITCRGRGDVAPPPHVDECVPSN